MNVNDLQGVYGAPPLALADVGAGAIQLSPLHPGAQSLEAAERESFSRIVMLAPPGTVERRYAVALALRALVPDGRLVLLAPKDKGGSRLKKELEAFGCAVFEDAKRHHRICTVQRPPAPVGIEEAVAAGSPRFIEALGLWSQPGVFSWDRADPGSALLAANLPALSGKGADFGCGVGYLARVVLTSPKVERLTLIDTDRRAIEAARRNIDDPRTDILWADVRGAELSDLDFVVMNPPFHDGGQEDRALGAAFIKKAAEALKKGGVCWLVANRHLPYEAVVEPLFTRVTLAVETGGYKVYEARK